MEKNLERFKGIHPGLILERELKKRHIKPSPFAHSIDAHKQTFNAIIKGKRGISITLALKVDEALELEEGTFALLQTYYDIAQTKQKEENRKPNLKVLRKALFWDTDIEKIDWQKQYKAVIQRVYERGNKKEQEEIAHFYGESKIKHALADPITNPMTLHTNK
ncbi:helix-turn-helix transcriptional regulator [Sphingobacterium faecale]|uniref:Plasmid maintenance system antidote protein n=1 Tax=Sphingobacterium faecale TaxID=2803775 RepID=A0ABS1R811_9SPHI|nr:plasmid maintenance system antidote protein [Sphingobacterium faecale]MBL1410808.1 plasmid maintenance system antidote protein [Sphingobacterium faecale]